MSKNVQVVRRGVSVCSRSRFSSFAWFLASRGACTFGLNGNHSTTGGMLGAVHLAWSSHL